MGALPLLLFKGVPDDRLATINKIEQIGSTDEQELVIHGLMQIGEIASAAPGPIHSIWFNSPVTDLRLPPAPIHAVNCVADPDRSHKALTGMASFAEKMDMIVLNKPQDILKTDRVSVANALRPIDGIEVPDVIRLAPTCPEDIFRAARETEIDFPFLVRNTATHGGQLVRLNSLADRDRLFELSWGGQEVYITAFRDFASADGLYRKYRVMMIGDEIILRHVIIGKDYLLRMEKRVTTEAARQEEEDAITRFDTRLGVELSTRLQVMKSALGLDIFGVDFALGSDGQIILFEANAAMNFFYNPSPGDIWDAPVARSKAALRQLLSQPSDWLAVQ